MGDPTSASGDANSSNGQVSAASAAPAGPSLVVRWRAASGRGLLGWAMLGCVSVLPAVVPPPVLAASALAAPLRAPGAAPQASAARTAPTEPLLRFEFEGRARPEATAPALAEWMHPLPADAPERVAALELLGWWAAHTNDPDASERAAVQLDLLAQGSAALRTRALAGAALVRSKWASLHGTLSRADRLLAEALGHLPASVPAHQRLRYLLLAGDIRKRGGKLDEAVRWYLQAMAMADTQEPAWRRADIRSSLAYLLHVAGQKDRARALNREAIELATQAGDDLSLALAMTTESILLSLQNQDTAELAALRAAIEHARRAGAKREEILGLANIADYYLQRGQYAIALAMSERALPLAREVRSTSSESLALTNMGLALISMHRKAEGIAHVQAALAIEERTGSFNDMADTYRELGTYLERAGEHKEAFEAYKQYRRLADEVFRQEHQQAILELQEDYDNQRRNRELELLNRENRLKEEQLLQRDLRHRQWAMVAALGVLSVSVIVLLLQRARRANRQLARTNELLKVQSERDPLTGLANRRHLQQAMRRQDAAQHFVGTVYLLDIDHFKQINDQHGHAAGDAVLVESARRLRTILRDQDLIVRWGGEEFVVIVQSLSPDRVEGLAHRLLHAIADSPVQVDAARVPLSASIGFATFPLEPAGIPLGWEQAIELVDTAMYLAKAHGRNRAYGIRLMHASNAADAMAMSRNLEQHWQDGQVALTLQHGPALQKADA